MKKELKVCLILLLSLVLVSLGCIAVFSSAEAKIIVLLKADGGISYTMNATGALGEDSETLSKDCSANIKQYIDITMSSYAAELSSIKATTNPTEEQKQREDKLSNAINALIEASKNLSCDFTKTAETGNLSYTVNLSYESLKALNALEEKPAIEIEKKADGSIEARIKVTDDGLTGLPNIAVKEITISPPGNVISVSPDKYSKVGTSYVFSDIPTIKHSTITADYTMKEIPTPPVPGTTEQAESILSGITSVFSSLGEQDFLGFAPYIIGAVVLIAVIVIILKSARHRQKEIKKITVLTKEEQLQKKILSKEPRASGRLIEVEEVAEEPKADEPLTIQEKADVDKLVGVLRDKIEGYSSEEIMQAVKNQGYTERVAKEVLKKLSF